MRRRLAVALAALGLAAAAPAWGERPSVEWRTIETARFRVHFPAPFERFAQRAAASLEAVAPRVTEYIGYTPPRRIDVLVSDPAADANGIAFPFLDRPYIELWATPPDPESGLGDFPRLDRASRHARIRPHRPPDPAAQSAGCAGAHPAASHRTRVLELAALGRRGLRDSRRGRAHRIRAALVDVPGDGPAAIRDRGEASVVRSARRDVGLARRVDGVPRRLELPRMARGARRVRQPAAPLEADGVPPGRRLRRRVCRRVRAPASGPVRPLSRGGDRPRHRAGEDARIGRARRRREVAAPPGEHGVAPGESRRHAASRAALA